MGFFDFFRKPARPKKPLTSQPERDGFAAVKKTQKQVKAPALELTEDSDRKTAPPAKGFDPYNSGAYDRRGAWEKVTRK